MKNLLTTIALILLTNVVSFAQSARPNYDIRLEQVSNSSESSCYEVQIRSSRDQSFYLAGQNYRLFYDATDVSFNPTLSYSMLPGIDYTDLVVVQNIQNVNASAFSDLSFSSNLSFLNYYIDLNDVFGGGIEVPAYDNGWAPTSHICFDHNSPNVENGGFDAVWGRPGKTETLATAFVEVSEWIAPNVTGIADRYLMFDEMADDAQTSYDIRLHMSSTSPSQSCYQIQLKTNNHDTWKLAGQNYRLFFDADQVQYQPSTAVSLLPSEYTDYTNVSHFNGVNASGYGSLPYESNLGFINTYIDLDNLTKGGVIVPNDQTWLPTAEFCFEHIDQKLLDEEVVCFDAAWGRDGLTDTYATAFVEVSKWISPTASTSTKGYEYFDLKQSQEEALPRSSHSDIIAEMSITPNPVTEFVNLDFNSDTNAVVNVSIYNAKGQVVYDHNVTQQNGKSGKNSLNIPVEHLNTGQYFLTLNNNGKSDTKSFVKF